MAVRIEDQSYAGNSASPGEWVASHAPAANTQATVTKAAPGTGKQHVVTTIIARLVAGATAPTAATATVSLVDGSTTIAAWPISIPAVAGENAEININCNIDITENAAVKLEFGAASGLNTIQSVMLAGYIKNAVSEDGTS